MLDTFFEKYFPFCYSVLEDEMCEASKLYLVFRVPGVLGLNSAT